MHRFVLLFGLLATFSSIVGCGGQTSSLSTDSGKMTIEEYNAIQEAEEAKISEAMKNPSN
jgi:hypothetical protein